MHPFKHFWTITRHRHKVLVNCFKCHLFRQGLTHDLSKYSLSEFIPGAKYYVGTKSPNEPERQENGYSLAWMHHKGRNKHHCEYWNDISPVSKRYESVVMPVRYVAEMFCDRIAASKIYKGKAYKDTDPRDYFQNGHARPNMNPVTADLLESWLVILADQGEKTAFRTVRKALKEDKIRRREDKRRKKTLKRG